MLVRKEFSPHSAIPLGAQINKGSVMFKKIDDWISKNPGEFLTLLFFALTFGAVFLLMLVIAGDAFLGKI